MDRLVLRPFRLTMSLIMVMCLTGMQHPDENFEERLLTSHNLERAAMGVSPLNWDDDLARGAESWANHLAATGKFEHSPDRPGDPLQGENIWGGTPDAFAPERMVGLWIAEKANFKPGTFPFNSKTDAVQDVSHYTQLIWRDTTRVGCALSEGESEEILVCRYSSPGNVVGKRPI